MTGMSAPVRSESVSLLSAPESSLGVQPTSGWRQHQPNGGGIKNFYPNIKRVRRQPLTPYRADFKGDVIDLDAAPQIDHDLNKDLVDYFAPGIFLVQTLYSGTTGTTATGKFYPSAVSSTQFTVASGGALVAGTLIFARGFINSANNGLLVVQAASTGTAIKTTGTVTESSPPANATVEVVGFQGAASDIVAATASTITSTALDFTTLNIPIGSWLWIGGGTASSPGTLGFATAADRGFIRITAIAAHTLTFDRATTTWVNDTGTGKTIQIFFGWFVSDVAYNSTNYLETTYQFELGLPGLDSGAATDYVYSIGNFVDTWELNGAAQNKIVSTLTFRGQDIQNPLTTRATGASSALAPLATALFNTVTELPRLRVADKTGTNYNASISVDIDTWKLMFKNNVTAQKQQGTFGMKRGITGRCNVTVDIKAFLIQNDMILAMRDNRDLMFEACLRNNDAGIVIDLPRCEISGGATDYPLNGIVTISETLNAVLDTTLNFVCGMTVFPFLPAN
jgi:hypothetical protein